MPWYHGFMAIITIEDLAKWTQSELDEVSGDPFAIDLVEKVSLLACHIGGHSEWMTASAPIDVWMVVLNVCKRSYENPGRVIQETTGPLGERVIEDQALFTEFSEAERATLGKYNPDNAAANGPMLFTISTDTSGPSRANTGVDYVFDNQQINLGDVKSWDIPFTVQGDGMY